MNFNHISYILSEVIFQKICNSNVAKLRCFGLVIEKLQQKTETVHLKSELFFMLIETLETEELLSS